MKFYKYTKPLKVINLNRPAIYKILESQQKMNVIGLIDIDGIISVLNWRVNYCHIWGGSIIVTSGEGQLLSPRFGHFGSIIVTRVNYCHTLKGGTYPL